MPENKKVRVHVKNNHASPDTFPPTVEGEAVFTITQERFEASAQKYPDVAKRLDVFFDWDLDHFEESMRTAEVLVTWDLPTANLPWSTTVVSTQPKAANLVRWRY